MTVFTIATVLILSFLARFNFFRIPHKGILILLYHRIGEVSTHTTLDKFSVSKKQFEKQMVMLKKMGYKSISPKEIDNIIQNKLYTKNRFVLVTFDDGYKDNIDAAKILHKHSMSGLFFIITSLIGKQYNGVDMLSEKDLKNMVSLGMHLGSHSKNHIKLSEINKTEAENDIKESIQYLNKFESIGDFAYPYGNFNQNIIEILKNLKIRRAYIIGQRIFRPKKDNRLKIPRAIIRKNTNLIDFYLIATRGRSKF